jgi:hypothetical protein
MQQFAPDGTMTEPYITVVAAPALTTIGKVDATHPPGLSLSDFWDDTVPTSAICDFLRREDELMTELMNHKRSTS